MAKTFGFLTGLAVGAVAAYGAFKSLSPEKQEKIVKGTQEKFGSLRDTALDYAYNATDKLEGARESMTSHREGSLSPVDLVARSYELADKAKGKVQEVVEDVKEKVTSDDDKVSENDDISVDLTKDDDAQLPKTDDVKSAFNDTKSEVLEPTSKVDNELLK